MMMLMWTTAAACGGSTPTSPGLTCEPVASASGLEQSATTMRLYDGATLLGEVLDYHDSVVFWKSTTSLFGTPNSPYWFRAPAVAVDFRSIVNGTIDGRFEFTVTRGSVRIERLDLATLMPVSLTDPSGFGAPASVSGREICR